MGIYLVGLYRAIVIRVWAVIASLRTVRWCAELVANENLKCHRKHAADLDGRYRISSHLAVRRIGFSQTCRLLAKFLVRFQAEWLALVQFRKTPIFGTATIALQQIADTEIKDYIKQCRDK
jgi:hypothetical protein